MIKDSQGGNHCWSERERERDESEIFFTFFLPEGQPMEKKGFKKQFFKVGLVFRVKARELYNLIRWPE